MGILRNRAIAAVLAGIMVAAAIFIGLSSGPVAQTDAFYVADYANVLSPQAESYIAEQSRAVGQATGARVFVVTVEGTGVKSIESYFNSLVKAWKLDGYADVMLLLDFGGDDYYFAYGSDWWSVFEHAYSDMRNMYLEPSFATGRYEDGVLDFYDAVCAQLGAGISRGEVEYYPPVVTQAYAVYPRTSLASTFIVIFIILILLIVLSGRRPRYHRRSIFAPPRPRYYSYGRPFFGAPYHRPHRPAPPPRRRPPPRPPSGGFFGGGFSGGGRSGGGFSGGGRSGGGFSGGGRSGGGFSGGGRSGGGFSGGGRSGGGFSGGGRSGGGFSGGGRSGGGFSGGGRSGGGGGFRGGGRK